MRTTFTLVILSLLSSSVAAWPMGAGGCPQGVAAVVGSVHTQNPNVRNGTLEDAPQGLQVLLNGTVISVDAVTSVAVGEPMDIQLMGNMPFKGFLIRLGPHQEPLVEDEEVVQIERAAGMDLTMALNPISEDSTDVKLEERYCIPDGVSGVCHTSNDEKTMVTATLEAPRAMDYIMDVTVVIALSADASEYYHTSYALQAAGTATGASRSEEATVVTPEATTSVPEPQSEARPEPAAEIEYTSDCGKATSFNNLVMVMASLLVFSACWL